MESIERMERFELVRERIRLIPFEKEIDEPYGTYFKTMAIFIDQMAQLYECCANGTYHMCSLAEKEKWSLLCDKGEQKKYEKKEMAKELLGEEFGAIFSFLTREWKALYTYAIQQNLYCFMIYMELYMELYTIFEDSAKEQESVPYKRVKEALYWFFSDYSDVFIPMRIKECFSEGNKKLEWILKENQKSDCSYLYEIGEEVTEKERKRADHVLSFSEEEVAMICEEKLQPFVEEYLEQKKETKEEIFLIHYERGQERFVEEIKMQLQEKGIFMIPYEKPVGHCNRQEILVSLFEEKEEEVRDDLFLYFDKAFVERVLSVTKTAYEEWKEPLKQWAGVFFLEALERDEKEEVSLKWLVGKEVFLQRIQEKIEKEQQILLAQKRIQKEERQGGEEEEEQKIIQREERKIDWYLELKQGQMRLLEQYVKD